MPLSFIRNFPPFKKYPIIKEFIKFCLVGLTNLAVDFCVYWILTRLLSWYYLLAAVGSFLVSVSWSFFINKRWTFRHRGGDLRGLYFKFLVANTLSIIFNLGLLYIFVDFAHLHDLLAKLISSFIVAFLNFSLNKFWTFKARPV